MAEEQFYTILTTVGKAKVANAALLSSNVTLKTLKVGDSNGSYYSPTEEQKELRNVVYSCDVGSVKVDENNPNWIIAETIIPGSVGGFTIREIGLFDIDGDMIAVGKYPETYKPQVSNGASKDLCVRTIFEVSNTESVRLSLDPSVIIATRDDINNLQKQIDENRAHLNALANSLTFKSENITALSNWSNTDDSNPPFIGKSLRNICFLADLKGGITTNDTIIMKLPTWAYPFRTRSFPVMSCGEDWVYRVGVITITTNGDVVLSGGISNTKLTICVSYQV